MSKTLKKSECFLRFILDPLGCKKQIRYILHNISSIQLGVLTEIFHNILKNQHLFGSSVKRLIQKRKKLLNKFTSSFKQKSDKKQKQILLSNIKIFLNILFTVKNIIFEFLNVKNALK